jgi:hypothetical protein
VPLATVRPELRGAPFRQLLLHFTAARGRRPTFTAESDTLNSGRIRPCTMSRVPSANSNSSCRGSVPTISVDSRRIGSPQSLGGRPRALEASTCTQLLQRYAMLNA